MWSIIHEGVQRLKKLFRSRTATEEYVAGRLYALGVLSTDPLSISKLLDESDSDRCFGGNGNFDRGIADVLRERLAEEDAP
jgi:hypothetical protein